MNWPFIFPISIRKWCLQRMHTTEVLVKEEYRKLNEELKSKGYEVIVEIKQELRKCKK